jgi:hypothetical protein
MRAGLIVCLLAAAGATGCGGGGGGRSLGAYCTRVDQMRAQDGSFDVTSTTNTKAALDHSISQMETIDGVAPKDIEPDVHTIVNSLEAIRSGDTAAMQRHHQSFSEAARTLATYIGAHCGRNV